MRATPIAALLAVAACSGREAPPPPVAPATTRAPAPVEGSAPSTAAATSRGVTLAATGDVLFHVKVVAAARAHGFDHVLAGLREAIRDEDIAFANLETPLCEDVSDVRTGNPPILGAPAEAAAALAAAGLDVVGVANNHSYDQGAQGLARTADALRAAGALVVGAGVDEPAALRPARVEREGVRVAFLAATERVNQGPGRRPPGAWVARVGPAPEDELPLREALGAARDDADVVALLIHWSHDFREAPLPHQRERAARLIEAGADVLVGTGPHLLQPVEVVPSPRGQAVVAYSLGNLVSNQGLRWAPGMPPRRGPMRPMFDPGSRDGVLLRARLELSDDGEIHVEALDAVALWTHNNFLAWHDGGADALDVGVVTLASAADEIRALRRPLVAAALGPAVSVSP